MVLACVTACYIFYVAIAVSRLFSQAVDFLGRFPAFLRKKVSADTIFGLFTPGRARFLCRLWPESQKLHGFLSDFRCYSDLYSRVPGVSLSHRAHGSAEVPEIVFNCKCVTI